MNAIDLYTREYNYCILFCKRVRFSSDFQLKLFALVYRKDI